MSPHMTLFNTTIALWVLVSVISFKFTEVSGHEATEEPEASVTRCYKCEGDCNGGEGKVEGCYPDPGDTFRYACYKLVVDGKTFQRGCTRDFSEGEQCIEQRGGEYCFCRTDECNRGSIPNKNYSLLLFVLSVTFAITSFQRLFC